jgi:hypothetical protein
VQLRDNCKGVRSGVDIANYGGIAPERSNEVLMLGKTRSYFAPVSSNKHHGTERGDKSPSIIFR